MDEQSIRHESYGSIIDRVRECLTEFYQINMGEGDYATQMINEFTILVLAASE
jgi:hypothetical protein